jgi:hypothetical protein
LDAAWFALDAAWFAAEPAVVTAPEAADVAFMLRDKGGNPFRIPPPPPPPPPEPLVIPESGEPPPPLKPLSKGLGWSLQALVCTPW